MNEYQKPKIIEDLENYNNDLKSYKRRMAFINQASEAEKRYTNKLREKLVRKTGMLKGIIIEVTGTQYARTQFEGSFDIWSEAFNIIAFSHDETALTFCINAVNEAIGKLEDDINKGIRDEQGNLLGKPSTDTTKPPMHIFDNVQFHPRIIDASRALFEDGHYAQAIFEAFKAVENFVQDKSDLDLYGTNLMETVFNEENPIIKVPEAGHYYKDVQRGFKHLFIGASQGIRNPKAHKEIIQKDPFITLQYLGFFSFLLKRIDYWEAGAS